jgi:uncharacterized membrane protein
MRIQLSMNGCSLRSNQNRPICNSNGIDIQTEPNDAQAMNVLFDILLSLRVIRATCITAILLGLVSGNALSKQDAAELGSKPSDSAPTKIIEFNRDVEPILKDRCQSCHQGEKAQNGFVVMDRTALLGFIEPGNASASSLWTDYLTQPSKLTLKDSLVMPPDGPLSASQLAVLKIWMDEGADISETKEVSLDSKVSFPTKVFRAIGYFHPAVIHFPIVLFTLGGIAAFGSYFMGPRSQTTAYHCLLLATLSGIVAVAMGWSFAEIKALPAWPTMPTATTSHDDMNKISHRWLGTATAVLGVLVSLIATLARRKDWKGLGHLWRIGAIALAALVGIVGHQGGELVYGDIFEKALEQLRK